ncbi:MAG: type IV pilus assembly protein PilM [Patescibacteria group bacterium]
MNSVVGIDLGMGSIKVVALSRNGESYFLDLIGEAKTPRLDWYKTGGKKAMEEVAKVLKNLLKELKVDKRQVVASLPENEVVSRLVSLPPLKENEIGDALKFEAETFVPYPLDQVLIDYEVMETDDAGRLTVFAIAARNDLIAAYIKLFKMAGLEMAAIESPAVSARRLINQMGVSAESVMMFDIGEKFSDIISFNKGNIFFARSLPIGGESITRAISVNLGLDMASAEEYKKAYGIREMELEGKIKNAIMPVFGSMAEEIRRAMALYTESFNKPVDLLMLSGGGAKMPGLAEELTRVLGVEVQVVAPFLKIDVSRVVAPIDLNLDAYRFSLATGLALRGWQ